MNRRSGFARGFSVAAIALLLSACETAELRPLMTSWNAGFGFGYSEKRLDNDRFEVRFVTPFIRTVLDPKKRGDKAGRLRELAYELGLWRAAQLAIDGKRPAFAVESRKGEIDVETYDDTPRVQRYGLAHPQGGYRFIQTPSPEFRSAWMQATAVLVITLKGKAGKGDLDAHATVDRMAVKHAGAHSLRTY